VVFCIVFFFLACEKSCEEFLGRPEGGTVTDEKGVFLSRYEHRTKEMQVPEKMQEKKVDLKATNSEKDK